MFHYLFIQYLAWVYFCLKSPSLDQYLDQYYLFQKSIWANNTFYQNVFNQYLIMLLLREVLLQQLFYIINFNICLQVVAVIRKPAMRTARNIFIVNLAVSDLLLCVITMPLTLVEILTKYWPLGQQIFVCKMIGTLQATSIFVSTISITAIALDRYQVCYIWYYKMLLFVLELLKVQNF